MNLLQKIILTIFLMTFISCQKELEQFDVSQLSCDNVNTELTPQMVEKNPNKYVGECVEWIGRVSNINETGSGLVYIIPVPEKYNYCGKTQLSITLVNKIEYWDIGETWLPDMNPALMLCEYLYGDELPNIFTDDYVKFKGKILGETKREHPLFKDRFVEFPLIAIIEIEKYVKK